jgi:hypothetical protein
VLEEAFMTDVPASAFSLELEKPVSSTSPVSRLSDAGHATEIVQTLIFANEERAMVDAKVKGMLDGNAPYAWGDLKRAGQENRTNVNFREGEAAVEAASGPYYDLFAETETYARVEIDHPDLEKKARFSRFVTDHFDRLMKDWSGFDWAIQTIIYDMVSYGKGFAFFNNRTDWQFCSVRHSKVLVPDQSPSDIEQMEIMVMRQSYLIHELWDKIKNESSTAVGWDRSAVLAAIANAVPEYASVGGRSIDYELLQQELRNHDIYQSTRSQKIKCAHIFVREFNGHVTHSIVEETTARRSSDGRKPQVRFLFHKIGRYKNFRQIICPVFYDVGDGTWHSIKGMAIKMYPFLENKNRLSCAVIDNAFLNMSVLVKPTTSKIEEPLGIMQVGPLSILPNQFEVQNWGIAGRMEEGLAVERYLSMKLEENLGQYRRPLMRDQGNPPTARQVSYEAQKTASLTKGSINRFYTQMDLLFEEIYSRVVNPNLVDDSCQNGAAMEFQRACEEFGISKAALMRPISVRATRAMGNGSVFLKEQAINNTAQIVPMMNEAGRQAWIDSAIAVMAGSENVDRWNPKGGMTPTLANEQAYAILENNAMSSGSPVAWTPTQNNFIHSTTHLKAANDAAATLQGQQGNPAAILSFLQLIGAHVTEHLQHMLSDPTQAKYSKIIADQLKALGKIVDQLTQMMAQAQAKQEQQAQAQQETMNDLQLKQMEVQEKLRMAQEKTDAALRMKEEKHAQSMALADAGTAGNMNRTAEAHQQQMDTSAQAHAQQMELAEQKAKAAKATK